MLSSRPVIVVLGESADDRPPFLDVLQGRAELRFTDAAGLGDSVQGAQGLFLWDFFSAAVAQVWERCGDLDWIHVAAAGVDSLLFQELRDSDVTVTNARGTFDRPIAEFVLASVLAHAKLVHESYRLQQQHVWRHRETQGLAGARALVIGTGAIGREIARLLRAVGMEVRGAGRTAREGDPDFGTVVASTDLATEVGWCDHLINAAPLTPATRGLVDGAVLAAMRPTAHLVNIGRGASVVQADLAAALADGVIAGATLDVFEEEPLPADSPLWDAPGCVISAHMSGDIVGWRDTLARQFLANAERWLTDQPLHNVVDKQLGFVPGEAP